MADRARIGKHIAGHGRSYTVPPGASHSQTMPPITTTSSAPEPGLTKYHSEPPSADSISPSSFHPEPLPLDLSDAPAIDLETGRESESPICNKQHWWSRSRHRHSPVTAAAHQKSAFELFKDVLFSSWANVLLIFVPVGIALHFVNVSPTVVFVMNFLAIIPLAGVCLLRFFLLCEEFQLT
jgi:hypothetical protein